MFVAHAQWPHGDQIRGWEVDEHQQLPGGGGQGSTCGVHAGSAQEAQSREEKSIFLTPLRVDPSDLFFRSKKLVKRKEEDGVEAEGQLVEHRKGSAEEE